MIESVTPIDFPDRAEFGQEVAEDARDGGADGQQISEQAREQGRQPAVPGGQTDEHRPAGVPDGPPTGLPTPDQTLPETAQDRPDPDDLPGAFRLWQRVVRDLIYTVLKAEKNGGKLGHLGKSRRKRRRVVGANADQSQQREQYKGCCEFFHDL